MNADITYVQCFGLTEPVHSCWLKLADCVASDGWASIDRKTFASSLASSVDVSYSHLASAAFKDIDTDFEYVALFDNQLKAWKLTMPGSAEDAVDHNDAKAFFISDEMKRICKRADMLLSHALEACKRTVMPHMKLGHLLEVDDVKLEAVMYMLEDSTLRKALKSGKFITV